MNYQDFKKINIKIEGFLRAKFPPKTPEFIYTESLKPAPNVRVIDMRNCILLVKKGTSKGNYKIYYKVKMK